MRNLVLHAQPHASQIDVNCSGPVLQTAVVGWCRSALNASVVKGNVETAKTLDRRRDQLFYILWR